MMEFLDMMRLFGENTLPISKPIMEKLLDCMVTNALFLLKLSDKLLKIGKKGIKLKEPNLKLHDSIY